MIAPYIDGQKLKILDACCGAGHIIHMLNQIAPESDFIGVDLLDFLIERAQQLCTEYDNIAFRIMNVYSLSENFDKEFDICINWKTLSWFPYYEEILNEIVSVTKKHIFISSLFYDGDIDFEIKVKIYKKRKYNDYHASYYNVYSLPKFKHFCYSLGIKEIKAYDFNINIDLPHPPINKMVTETIKLANGQRLQISGAVVMFWKVIRIDI